MSELKQMILIGLVLVCAVKADPNEALEIVVVTTLVLLWDWYRPVHKALKEQP